MIPFIFNSDEEDDDESLDSVQDFAPCETSEECYACTGRITLDFDLCQAQEVGNVYIGEDETILLCRDCLQKMGNSMVSLFGISYNPVDAFSWMPLGFIAIHPDSMN